MIVDSGAPISLLSAVWLQMYLKEMEVDEKNVEEKYFDSRFRFGESLSQ